MAGQNDPRLLKIYFELLIPEFEYFVFTVKYISRTLLAIDLIYSDLPQSNIYRPRHSDFDQILHRLRYPSHSKQYPRLRKTVLQTPEHKTPKTNISRPYNPFSQGSFSPYLHTIPLNVDEQDQLYLSYRHFWPANPEQDRKHLMDQDKGACLNRIRATATLFPRLKHTFLHFLPYQPHKPTTMTPSKLLSLFVPVYLRLQAFKHSAKSQVWSNCSTVLRINQRHHDLLCLWNVSLRLYQPFDTRNDVQGSCTTHLCIYLCIGSTKASPVSV